MVTPRGRAGQSPPPLPNFILNSLSALKPWGFLPQGFFFARARLLLRARGFLALVGLPQGDERNPGGLHGGA